MKIKKRTLNELRQTKDSHYVTPKTHTPLQTEDIIAQYISFMKNEGRIAQASLINFKYYLEKNNFSIIKTH